jgi:hypothetical protein
MKKIIKYLLALFLLNNFLSCKILKKNKKCDCPEFSISISIEHESEDNLDIYKMYH